MKLFGLTNHGLAAIGLLTLALWGVLWAEHSLNQRTQENYQDLMREWPSSPAHNSTPDALDAGSVG
ncbi:MAG: hypothetical protein O3A53_12620 [Acidobacteria bacterium]|nr:hypothetical protein [Acidobacteriota bacterium]MDA1235637.1 hypothetical protein [Acidobacteriota bacterium]